MSYTLILVDGVHGKKNEINRIFGIRTIRLQYCMKLNIPTEVFALLFLPQGANILLTDNGDVKLGTYDVRLTVHNEW